MNFIKFYNSGLFWKLLVFFAWLFWWKIVSDHDLEWKAVVTAPKIENENCLSQTSSQLPSQNQFNRREESIWTNIDENLIHMRKWQFIYPLLPLPRILNILLLNYRFSPVHRQFEGRSNKFPSSVWKNFYVLYFPRVNICDFAMRCENKTSKKSQNILKIFISSSWS